MGENFSEEKQRESEGTAKRKKGHKHENSGKNLEIHLTSVIK